MVVLGGGGGGEGGGKERGGIECTKHYGMAVLGGD